MDTVDELEIRNLIARVARTSDQWKNMTDYVANYTDDCSWQIAGTDPYIGHEGLRQRLNEMLAQGICGPGLPARHCITSLEVIASSKSVDEALAFSVAVMITRSTDNNSTLVYGDYRDRLRRVDGKWLIASREIAFP